MLTRCLLLTCLLSALAANASAKVPVTVFLAGDSTMAKKLPGKRPETGWGEALPKFFREGSVRIENRAQNGRSTRTFIEQGLWQGIIHDIRKGDYVLIEFG